MAGRAEASDNLNAPGEVPAEETIVVEIKETECEIVADYQDGNLKEKFKTVIKSTKKMFATGGNTDSTKEDLADVRKKYWRMDSYYPFKGSPNRRYMLHIVNETFNNPEIPNREGALVDLKNINDISSSLGFKNLNKSDKINFTSEDIWKCLRETVEKLKLETESGITCECFLFFISTHGTELTFKNEKTPEHVLLCYEGDVVRTRDIIEMFNDQNCPPLRGKPKIFIIQACRGGEKDEGVEVAVLEDNPNKSREKMKRESIDAKGRSSIPVLKSSADQSDAKKGSEAVQAFSPSIICDSDMIIMYAIPPKFAAWRNSEDGSWMIHYLHKVIQKYNNFMTKRPTNFLKLLTQVASEMAIRETTPKQQSETGKLEKDRKDQPDQLQDNHVTEQQETSVTKQEYSHKTEQQETRQAENQGNQETSETENQVKQKTSETENQGKQEFMTKDNHMSIMHCTKEVKEQTSVQGTQEGEKKDKQDFMDADRAEIKTEAKTKTFKAIPVIEHRLLKHLML